MKHHIKKFIVILIVLGVVGTASAAYFWREKEGSISYRTVPVTRGDVLATIGATGTVEPEEVIDVGAQVAGQILAFGKDAHGKTIDYGSVVKAGTVLARIDDSLYEADAAQAEAEVQTAKAGLKRAKADLEQMRARLFQAEQDWKRAQKIGPSEALAQASFDAYEAGYEAAKANVAVGEATIRQAQASVKHSEAALWRARRNLGYCTIKSPVEGVIIDRRVNIGQTVVASLNAPSLFLIAKDLTRLQVWVAVNEADIGKIHPGQPVTFTVDAFPGEIFQGEVGKVRLNASMTQNVVTYTVEIVTDNASGRLLPYLTANVRFEIARASSVLRVPNAGLRWKPKPEEIEPALRKSFDNITARKETARSKLKSKAGHAIVWIQEGFHVRPIGVRTGINDGSMTEVEGDGLTEGMKIVTG
ncbi:MAG: efflux RND transporter periplasmic adaptor subunit, partial [Deltaproteobacteria bacterium]